MSSSDASSTGGDGLSVMDSDPWSIFTTILLSFGIGSVLFTSWLMLRTRKRYFFAPKAPYDPPIGLPETREHKTLGEVFRYSRKLPEKTLVESYGGVDHALYIRFLKYSTLFFAAVSILGLAVLIPVNNSGLNKNLPVDSLSRTTGLNTITVANIESGSGSMRLWAHVVFLYVYTVLAMIYMFFIAKSAAELLPQRVRPEAQAYSIMVSNLETDLQKSDAALANYYAALQGEDRLRGAIVAPKLRELHMLAKRREKAFRKWQTYAARLADTGERLQTRTGPFGLFGEKVDAVNYYRDQIHELDGKMQRECLEEMSGSSIGFVSFDSCVHAMEAARGVEAKDGSVGTSEASRQLPNAVRNPNKRNIKKVLINKPDPAPDPEDINWKYVGFDKKQRVVGNVIAFSLLLAVFIFFYPAIVVASGLANFGGFSGTAALNVDGSVGRSGRFSQGIVSGVVATIILVAFSGLLPTIIRACLSFRGYQLRSKLDRDTMTAYWCFLFMEIFLGFTAAGTIFNRVGTLFSSSSSIVDLLAMTLTAQSTFYINWLSLRAFLMLPLGYTRIVNFLFFKIKERLFFKSKVDRMYALAPPVFPYYLGYAIHSFNFCIGLTYSIIAPLTTPFILFYFAICWAWERHQAAYVNAGGYESVPLTPRVMGLLSAGVITFQLTTIGVLALKQFTYVAVAAVPLVAATVYFAILPHRYRESIHYIPLEECAKAETDGRISRSVFKRSDGEEAPVNNIEYYRDPALDPPKSMEQFMAEYQSGSLVIRPDKEISGNIAAKGGMSQAL